VSNQRQFYKKGKLSQERATQLEGIRFDWGTMGKTEYNQWEERFNELTVYEEKNGNCNVPCKQGKLGKWVSKQRHYYKKGKLSKERSTQLEGIGFDWSTRKKKEDKQWEERLNELFVYKEKNGNYNVPQKLGALGIWVMHQRQSYKKGKLSQERTRQLEGIGFNWIRKQKSDSGQWEERSNELVIYKEKNDTCNVPQNQGALGRWVSKQRHYYKKGKLSQERVTQLEGIGFVWKLQCGTGTPSTQVHSDWFVDGGHDDAGCDFIDSVAGMFDCECPALPPLPPEQEDMDSESNTLSSDSQVKTND